MVIDGKAIANELLARAQEFITGMDIGLAVVLVGDDAPSRIYVTNKLKSAQKIGMRAKLFEFPENTSEETIKATINNINLDPSIDGALIQLPLPEHIHQHSTLNTLSPHKDVDGFTVHNVGLLNTWQDCLEPSTPQGCLYLLKRHLGNDLSGKKAVVIGRSLIVGRPMSSMLIRESCSVTLLHSMSKNVIEEASTADILITAIGKPNLIDERYIKPGAFVVDVGITKIGDRIVGDVNFDAVRDKASHITPVPGGVGPLTVAFMILNTIKAHCIKHKLEKQYYEFYKSL